MIMMIITAMMVKTTVKFQDDDNNDDDDHDDGNDFVTGGDPDSGVHKEAMSTTHRLFAQVSSSS